jgi:hypothetical protein
VASGAVALGVDRDVEAEPFGMADLVDDEGLRRLREVAVEEEDSHGLPMWPIPAPPASVLRATPVATAGVHRRRRRANKRPTGDQSAMTGTNDGGAFGAPGISPTWSSSDKDFVTTALGNARLWATVGHGIVNEIYWPSTGWPQYRDIGFYLLGDDRWIDLKRVSRYTLSKPKSYLPLLTIVHQGDDYRLSIDVLPDPRRDALLLRYALDGPYRLGIVAAPHLGATGHDNTAWVEDGALHAAIPGQATCIAANVPMADLSVGYVGASDGWQDLARNGRFTHAFRARRKAMRCPPRGTRHARRGLRPIPAAARTLAVSALAEGCDVRAGFVAGWEHGAPARAAGTDDALRAAAKPRRRCSRPTGPDVSRRHRRQHEHALGQPRQHARRLPPRVAA